MKYLFMALVVFATVGLTHAYEQRNLNERFQVTRDLKGQAIQECVNNSEDMPYDLEGMSAIVEECREY